MLLSGTVRLNRRTAVVSKIRTYSTDNDLVQERRKLIVERSIGVFLEKGFEKSTMRDLGKACGMTAGALYHYIGSKKDILHLISISNPLGAGFLKEHLAKLGKVSRKTALRECFSLFCQQREMIRDYLMFLERVLYKFSPEDLQIMAKSKMDVYDFFEQLITEGIETGEFQVRNPKLVVNNIMVYGYDWATRSFSIRQHVTLEEYADEQFRMLFEPAIIETPEGSGL